MLLAKKVASGFGKQLTRLREAAGLSQYELAKRSKVTAQAISRIEKDEREPNWITILKFARALNVSVAEFDAGGDPRQDDTSSQSTPDDETAASSEPSPKKPSAKKSKK